MANVKLSAIASGGAVNSATDTMVAVRSGTTDVLVSVGSLASQSGTFSGTHSGASSGTNTGDQTNISGNAATATLAANVTTNANLTGPITSVGNATAITNGAVTLAKIANAGANSVLVGAGAAGSGAAYTEITLGSGLVMTGTVLSSTGGTPGFDTITGATNVTAAMVVGTGSSLGVSGSGTITATTVTGASTITSTAATALIVGANGTTSPAFTVDCSTASSATGWAIKSAAAGGGVTLSVTSSGTNEIGTIQSKAAADMIINSPTGTTKLQVGGTTKLTCGGTATSFAQSNRGASIGAFWSFSPGTGASLTATSNAPLVDFAINTSQSWATGTVALQECFRIKAPTLNATAASTFTLTATLSVVSAPIAGGNANITAGVGIYHAGANVGSTTAASYALYMVANTGGTANYAAYLGGLNGIGTGITAPTAFCHVAGSTTASASINVPSGTAPTSPNDGDMWYDGTNVKFRVGGSSKNFTLV